MSEDSLEAPLPVPQPDQSEETIAAMQKEVPSHPLQAKVAASKAKLSILPVPEPDIAPEKKKAA